MKRFFRWYVAALCFVIAAACGCFAFDVPIPQVHVHTFAAATTLLCVAFGLLGYRRDES